MLKFRVKVRKYFETEVPVEAQYCDVARDMVSKLIHKGDTDFMFDGIREDCWNYEILFVGHASEEEFYELSRDTEVVHPDGTHSWPE